MAKALLIHHIVFHEFTLCHDISPMPCMYHKGFFGLLFLLITCFTMIGAPRLP